VLAVILTVSLGGVIGLLVLALAVASAAATLTKAKVSRPLRDWLDRRAYPDPADRTKRNRVWYFVNEAFTCPYCLSHWLALGAVAIYRPILVSCGFWPVDLLVSAMAIVTLSAWFVGLIFRGLSAVPELPPRSQRAAR
jgi:hypothetical protein